MKKQVELINLSKQVSEKSLMSPETYIIMGNTYSLQKEHETALKFFQRAAQLDDHFAYAHTLSAHEFIENEDFEKAKMCYQKSLQVDQRFYPAWAGLGMISLKQEQYD